MGFRSVTLIYIRHALMVFAVVEGTVFVAFWLTAAARVIGTCQRSGYSASLFQP